VRVLAVSNLFPPAFVGGYELGASWVCRELARRGHEVTVCTASRLLWAHVTHHQDAPCPPPLGLGYIDAGLAAFGFDLARLVDGGYSRAFEGARAAVNDALLNAPQVQAALRDAVARLEPDVVVVFNPAGLLVSPVQEILDACVVRPRVVAYVSDDWPTRWPAAHPLSGLAHLASGASSTVATGYSPGLASFARLLASQDLFAFERTVRFDQAMFCSEFLRRKCVSQIDDPPPAVVAHWGLPAVAALPSEPALGFDGEPPLTLAFAGQLLHHKGLGHIIRALPLMKRPHRLIVLGDDTSDYAALCRSLVETADLSDRVQFLGKVAPETAIQILHEQAQVLVVPSQVIPGVFEEPFSIVVLQGMALGMPVIATPTGGTPEAIVDGSTGRVCDVKDPASLSAIVDELELNRQAARAMGAQARRRVEEAFTIETMVDGVEKVLAGDQAAGTGVQASATIPQVLVVATNAARDPANTGCVRVTRQLGRALEDRHDVAFVAWHHPTHALRALTSAEREVLSRFNGPRRALGSGRIDPAAAALRSPRRLRGAWLLVPEVLPEEEFAAIRAFARAKGMQLAAIFYDAIPVLRPELCAPRVSSGHAAYMRGLARCDRVFAISQTAANDLHAFWEARRLVAPKVVVWPLAGALEGAPRPGGADDDRREPAAATMLCVSTLEPRKGHARLLKALDEVSARDPELSWSMVLVGNRYAGSDDLAALVEAACARDPRIEWRGIVDDAELVRLYRKSAFTVYPSEIEGFGLPVAESLWFGRPCLCSDAGAVGELAKGGGCLAIDVKDERALADAIHRLLSDRHVRSTLAAEARARTARTWGECADDVLTGLKPLGNASNEPARLTDGLYAGLLADHWQMTHAERLAFLAVLDQIKPRCAIEVGTYRGGSLSALARASQVVFSIDIDKSVAERFADFHNVRFLTGTSRELLPELLIELQRQDLDPDFALIDGSHTAEDVCADLSAFLTLKPRRPLVIIGHDSANPDCRRGIMSVDWQSSPYVTAVELDFVPGSAQTALTKPLDQLWGGLVLVRMEPEPRTRPLVISSGAMRL
jgi:glycosyltransferase involved in cell wall biosynthesis